MLFDLDARTASLGIGEFADFTVGPRDALGGPSGLWRAQLGTRWHQQLRERTAGQCPTAEFEVQLKGRVAHRGWVLTLTGRIDQLVPGSDQLTVREIKTVTRPLPADETELRAEYPGYFVQLATYLALRQIAEPAVRLRGELLFLEAGSGLAQTIVLTAADDALFRAQLERVVEFLDARHRARERLRRLHFQPPFATLRPGQENTLAQLLDALHTRQSAILFEAPTGFGKTGVLLEAALTQLRAGHCERVLYLTGKATGQIQVARTLDLMTAPAATADAGNAVASWVVRPKAEHCIHTRLHCSRDACPYLSDLETRWKRAGLARFYLHENEPHDLPALRHAGTDAGVCPYEITRIALGFRDVWIGDFNYVFAPANRGLFYEQPGFTPARTLLLVDEAHNLPARVADVYSHDFTADDAERVRGELYRIRPPAPLMTAWEHWAHFLRQLPHSESLGLDTEDDARDLLTQLARLLTTLPLDQGALDPATCELLWQIPMALGQLEEQPDLVRHWWSPRTGELSITCLDAAPAIGATLREFGGVVLASATFGPTDAYAASLGLAPEDQPLPEPESPTPAKLGELNKRQTKKLFAQLTSGAALLQAAEARAAAAVFPLHAGTPWRVGAYDVAYDLRVDTTFQHRTRHYAATADTVSQLRRASAGPVAVFFPSYAYAEQITREVAPGTLRIALQPRLTDLAAQAAWVETSLAEADALFLVLGSSFAESIDALGGRISHAMVVGPALPEVNAVQRARLATFASLGRDAAFRRVYQIPGMQKVNQALGRLVRAPGQQAKVLLHCRRFGEASYAALLADDYRHGQPITSDAELATWLTRPHDFSSA